MITLRHQGAVATIAERGAELCSCVTADGRERLWSGDAAVWSGHSPLLFPVIGRVLDDVVRVGGRAYPMTRHGLVRDKDFRLVEADGHCAVFAFAADERTLPRYPFRFALTVRHTLWADGFETACTVRNEGDAPMPYCIGGHPAFACPMEAGERFEDYAVRFEQPEDGEVTRVPGGLAEGTERIPLFGGDTLPLTYDWFDSRDTLVFERPRSRRVWLAHRQTGRGLSFAFADFDVLALWTMPGKHAPYLCVEPWNGLPSAPGESGELSERPYARTLAPGESHRVGYQARWGTYPHPGT